MCQRGKSEKNEHEPSEELTEELTPNDQTQAGQDAPEDELELLATPSFNQLRNTYPMVHISGNVEGIAQAKADEDGLLLSGKGVSHQLTGANDDIWGLRLLLLEHGSGHRRVVRTMETRIF
jgi:hypothetical protein